MGKGLLFWTAISWLCWSQPAVALPEVSVFAVGSNKSYKSGLPHLQYAEGDASRFVNAMQTVGLVPRARVTTMLSPTVAEFRQVLAHVAKPNRLGQQNGRKFVFYYSGHADESGIHLRDGAISKKELHESLAKFKAQTKVAIIDSCFSGSLTAKGVEPAPAFELPKVEFDEPSGSVFLSSAAGRQFSYESDRLESSIFTHHLIAGLYGEADGNVDGVVTVDELYQYVYRNTRWQTLNLPVKESQRPEIFTSLQGQGAVVLSFPSQTNASLALEKAIEGEVTIASAKGLQYFRVDKKPGKEKVLQLPAGSYQISVRRGKDLGRGDVTLFPTKMAFLSEEDLDWHQEPREAMGLKGKKLATRSIITNPADYKRWAAEFGFHDGFVLDDPRPGPYLMSSYRLPFAKRQPFLFAGYVGFSFHLNRYPKDDSPEDEFTLISDNSDKVITTSTGLWVGVWPEWDLSRYAKKSGWRQHLKRLKADFKVALGQTYHHQRIDGSSSTGGAAPGFQYGMGVIYRSHSGLGIGLRRTTERLNGQQISSISRPQGHTFSLTLLY